MPNNQEKSNVLENNMRKSLFKKASNILKEKKIERDFENETSIHFRITPSKFIMGAELLDEEYYHVSFFYEEYTLKHSCTCKNMSSSQPTNLCSHKIAALTHHTQELTGGVLE